MKDAVNKQSDPANDYASAKLLNDRVINIFTLVVDHNSTPDLTDVNRSYVFMVNELKQIYDRQPELKKIGNAICWRVLDNLEQAHELVPSIEFMHSGGDYGEGHNSSVSSLWILSGKKKPDLTPKLQKLLTEADDNIASFKSKLDKMYATLTFESISVPVVTIGDEKFRFTSMRDGIALNIISYCRAKHPNQQIDLESLRSELKDAGFSTNGINNLKENIRNSYFGDKSPLKPFVTVFPKVILVRQTTELSDEQVEKIRVACR
jgi:hypothetical protein